MYKSLIAILVLAILAPISSAANSVPTAPEGFTWFALPDSKALVLQPAGWSSAVEQGDGAVTYRFEPPDGPPRSFSIMMARGSTPLDDPQGLVQKWLDGITSRFAPIGDAPKPSTFGPFHVGSGFFIAKDAPDSVHRAFMQIVVNPKTGTLYVIGFETLASSWDDAWKIGQVCAGQFVLDDDD